MVGGSSEFRKLTWRQMAEGPNEGDLPALDGAKAAFMRLMIQRAEKPGRIPLTRTQEVAVQRCRDCLEWLEAAADRAERANQHHDPRAEETF